MRRNLDELRARGRGLDEPTIPEDECGRLAHDLACAEAQDARRLEKALDYASSLAIPA